MHSTNGLIFVSSCCIKFLYQAEKIEKLTGEDRSILFLFLTRVVQARKWNFEKKTIMLKNHNLDLKMLFLYVF